MTADRYEFHDLVFCSCELFKNFDSLQNVQQRRLNPRDTSPAFSLWQPVQLSLDNPAEFPGITIARRPVMQQAYLLPTALRKRHLVHCMTVSRRSSTKSLSKCTASGRRYPAQPVALRMVNRLQPDCKIHGHPLLHVRSRFFTGKNLRTSRWIISPLPKMAVGTGQSPVKASTVF